MKMHISSLMVSLAVLLSGCSIYAGDHKVIVEDYSQPAGHSGSKVKGFPDPVLPMGMVEAIGVCFPRVKGDC